MSTPGDFCLRIPHCNSQLMFRHPNTKRVWRYDWTPYRTYPKDQTSAGIWKTTGMSQEVSKWLVNGLYPQYTTFLNRL